MTSEELYFKLCDDRKIQDGGEKLNLAILALDCLANIYKESLWNDDRDDASELMVKLAGMALNKLT